MTRGTPKRAVRIPDDWWEAAQEVAADRGEDVSGVLRRALERYVRRYGTPPPAK